MSISLIFMPKNEPSMEPAIASCIRVSDNRICPYCTASCIIKNGRTKTGKQQYYCKSCTKRFIDYYSYKACYATTNSQIITLTKEGLGVRSTARVLNMSTTTLLKRILQIAQNIRLPVLIKGRTYEVDELRTYVKNKARPVWIVYALDRKSRQVLSFNVGSRTNKTLRTVIQTLSFSSARKIYTDKLRNYPYLIDKKVHGRCIYGTNHIERKNLSLRTHLKRLSRRTIYFSRSIAVLVACLQIYFFS